MDMGSHILDVARFLFGEPQSVYCTIARIRGDIRGEDVATIILRMSEGATVVCEMAYAGTPIEHDCFPQTFAFVECDNASIHLGPHYCLHVTTSNGTEVIHAPPPHFAWADPAYEVVHASIVPCHRDLLAGLRAERQPETTADDNSKTMRLVFNAYESAASNQVIHL
jgi:predicted dehydrogenase